jgi:hypothetical protein
MLNFQKSIAKAEGGKTGSDEMSMNNINSQMNNMRGAIISLENKKNDEGISKDQQAMLDQLRGKLEYLETNAGIVEL